MEHRFSFWAAFLTALLTLTLCLGLTACGDTETENSSSGSTSDAETSGTETSGVADESSGDTTEAPDPGHTPEVRFEPEAVTVGKIRIELLSDNLVRIEQAMSNGKFRDEESFTVCNRDSWFKVDYTTETQGANTVIKTANYHVVVPTGAANINNCQVTDPEGKVLWKYESKTSSRVFLPSPSDDLKSWYFSDNPRIIPSKNGYSVSEDGYVRNNGWLTDNNANDFFVFLPGGSYENFLKNFTDLTGKSEMINMSMLGYWDSRWYEYTTKTALNQIKEYQKRGYSIDMLVIDTDWRKSSAVGGVGYDINTRDFPDMKKFMEQAHALGVNIVFNDHPEPVKGTSSLLDKDEVEYRSKNLKMILSLGLDAWWYDRNWSVALNPIHNDVSIYSSGMYAYHFITEEYYNSIKDVDSYARRSLIMANVDGIWNGELRHASELVAHRYTLQWTGDIGTSSESLAAEIYNSIYGGAEMGLPYMSSDLGGHTSEVSREMYVRWIQFGALSTICRVHCTRPFSRMPWLYGETAEAVTKEYVGMRYRLMPLFYQLAHENYMTGLPVMRRLDIKYPQYNESKRNDEYLLGDYILIAPINGKTQNRIPAEWVSSDGGQGLTVQYYNNKNFSGTPVFTGTDTVLWHDWGSDGPSQLNNKEDQFSIRWKGEITFPVDCALTFYADDGVRVWIDGVQVVDGWSVYDTYLTTPYYKAGTTHEIRIDYFEDGGQAHIQMGYCESSDDKRDVFLPEGVWMDVWTGKEYTGPCTITAYHPLNTSPIFVRQGSILPLVKQTVNTSSSDWSKMTLDVYPSKNYSAHATIYEDDTRTDAYQDGHYRTTDIDMNFADGALNLMIHPAVGTFEGDRACTEREYTVRLHTRSNWGKITGITVNGTPVTFETVSKSADASPFAETGAALDGDVVTLKFTAGVREETVVRVAYEKAENDGENESYDKTAATFDVKVTNLTKNAVGTLNLTQKGELDWAFFGYASPTDTVRKAGKAGLIGEPHSDDGIFGFQDNYTIAWSDGDVKKSGTSTNGTVSRRNFSIDLKTGAETTYYTLYVGGWKGTAKLTVRDNAGNVQTVSFGNLTSNYYRAVTIACSSETASEIHVEYSIQCGENITLAAITASRKEN